jgi:hypothetical protein
LCDFVALPRPERTVAGKNWARPHTFTTSRRRSSSDFFAIATIAGNGRVKAASSGNTLFSLELFSIGPIYEGLLISGPPIAVIA